MWAWERIHEVLRRDWSHGETIVSQEPCYLPIMWLEGMFFLQKESFPNLNGFLIVFLDVFPNSSIRWKATRTWVENRPHVLVFYREELRCNPTNSSGKRIPLEWYINLTLGQESNLWLFVVLLLNSEVVKMASARTSDKAVWTPSSCATTVRHRPGVA